MKQRKKPEQVKICQNLFCTISSLKIIRDPIVFTLTDLTISTPSENRSLTFFFLLIRELWNYNGGHCDTAPGSLSEGCVVPVASRGDSRRPSVIGPLKDWLSHGGSYM